MARLRAPGASSGRAHARRFGATAGLVKVAAPKRIFSATVARPTSVVIINTALTSHGDSA